MINGISNWAGNVVITVIIVTILEMILPECKNKKYVKTVLGVYLLFIIISPVVKVVANEEINLENLIKIEESISSSGNNAIGIQTSSSIEEIYETNLENDIKNKLEQKGYNVSKMLLELELKDKNNYGKINKVSIQLEKQEITQNTSKKNINIIEIVEIEVGERNIEDTEYKEKTKLTNEEKQEIKKYLNTIYQVEENNITIT